MQTIKFSLPNETAKKLATRARERGLSPEAFVKMVTEEILSRPSSDFADALDHVLSKNTDLYERLAR